MQTISDDLIELTIQAYAEGYFPMSQDGQIGFYTCDPRSVYLFHHFHVPRRLLRLYRQEPFELRINTAFVDVVHNCRAHRPDEWIGDDQIALYTELHRRGHAHSIEAWLDGELAGGIFGTQIGAAFMAESMYHRITHASNICLIFMIERLQACRFHFCDIQYGNDHTYRFAPVDMPQAEFLTRLRRAVAADAVLTTAD